MIPGLLGTLSGGFRPTDIAGCMLWLDAAALTGFSNDDSIASCTPLVGPTLTGEAGGPVYKTGIINGLPVIRFGAGGTMIGTLAVTGDTLSCLFVASSSDAGSALRGIVVGDDGVADYSDSKYACIALSNNLTMIPYRNNVFPTGHLISSGVPFVESIVFDGSTVTAHFNGEETSVASTGTFASSSIILGRAASSVSSLWVGDIAEIVLYSSGLSSVNRLQLERHLAQKWGITIDQAPVNTVLPAISAAGWTPGQVASCDTGTWTNTPTTYTYQWQRKDGGYTNIPGATNATYLLDAADAGKYVRCGVVPSNTFATGTVAYSADSDLIA